ncbi:MAG: hypothetical protein JNM88_14300 [Chitinophagaceae bacterium]|nr:hypothetical protein [Chitinophagaceae bacterium]
MKKILLAGLLLATAILHNSCEKAVGDTETSSNSSSGITSADSKQETGLMETQAVSGQSRVYVEGTATLASNNTSYLVNTSGSPAKIHDRLNEFNGATFKAKYAGLYYVSMSASFDQRNKDKDHGDGFLGHTDFRDKNNNLLARSWGKIPFYEAQGSGTPVAVAPSIAMVYLNAGETLTFRLSTFGSTGNVVSRYSIVIYSLD